MDALDALAAEGRQAGKLARAISDCPAKLDDDERRAWRAGWRHGHEWLVANRRVYEAGVRAYGRGAPRRVA
jgi:ribosome modulation factor